MHLLNHAELDLVAGGNRPADELGRKMAPNEEEGAGGGTWNGQDRRRSPGSGSPFQDILKDPRWLDRHMPEPPPPSSVPLIWT